MTKPIRTVGLVDYVSISGLSNDINNEIASLNNDEFVIDIKYSSFGTPATEYSEGNDTNVYTALIVIGNKS